MEGGFESNTRTLRDLQCCSHGNQWKLDQSAQVISRIERDNFRALALSNYRKFTRSLTIVIVTTKFLQNSSIKDIVKSSTVSTFTGVNFTPSS